jgi:hypothetical protein
MTAQTQVQLHQHGKPWEDDMRHGWSTWSGWRADGRGLGGLRPGAAPLLYAATGRLVDTARAAAVYCPA